MKTYKLTIQGMTFEGSAHKLTDEEVQKLVVFKEDNSIQDWPQLYGELPRLLDGYDPYATNWWHASRPFLDDTLHFVLRDDADEGVWDKKLDELSDLYDLADKYNLPDGFEDIKEPLDAVPYAGQENILLSYEMLKGTFASYTIESDETPEPKDFAIVRSSIETPKYELELVEKLFYKNQELEAEFNDGWLRGKELVVEVFTSELLPSDEENDL
jgi:hypothetical protein